MTDIGVEVGQKMRSAIKAKLTELECYVDDELPDYIMVMIANKRTKAQMKEDLNLFLSNKTNNFVDWLHIVLKKLKEVQVTNPDVFKNALKRKAETYEPPTEDLEKVKKELKQENIKKLKSEYVTEEKSLTDDLPITVNKLSGLRKIVVLQDHTVEKEIDEDNFDIPLLSEINASNEEELLLLEQKIKNVKSRLGLQVDSDHEDDTENQTGNDEDCLNIKGDPDDFNFNEVDREASPPTSASARIISVNEVGSLTPPLPYESCKKSHTPITFDKEKDSLRAQYDAVFKRRIASDKSNLDNEPSKKVSVLNRLGRKPGKKITPEKRKRSRTPERLPDLRSKMGKRESREETNTVKKGGILSRLGVMSKVYIPPKRSKTPEVEMNEEEEMRITHREVPSIVKVQPRKIPPKDKQANPNLLLKAMAEAQKSIMKRPVISSEKSALPLSKRLAPKITKTTENSSNLEELANDPPPLFTKKYKEQLESKFIKKAKLLEEEKSKLKNLIVDMKKKEDDKVQEEERSLTPPIPQNQKFIITLDGVDSSKFKMNYSESKSIVRTNQRKTPSPIIFDKTDDDPKPKSVVPSMQLYKPPAKVAKIAVDKCKYWPACRLGDACEFYHPVAACKMFPNCKFADKCLYSHPPCKFETSCTKRDCPYSHNGNVKLTAAIPIVPSKPLQATCKFFPNCANPSCPFLHPKLCKFGIYCKNQPACSFVHTTISTMKSSLTWHSERAK